MGGHRLYKDALNQDWIFTVIHREEVSHNTSLTGVPVKVGQTLEDHSIFCIKEKILKNSVDISEDPFYQYLR